MKVKFGDMLLHLPSREKGRLTEKIKTADGKFLKIEVYRPAKLVGEGMLNPCNEPVKDYKKAFKRLGPPRRP